MFQRNNKLFKGVPLNNLRWSHLQPTSNKKALLRRKVIHCRKVSPQDTKMKALLRGKVTHCGRVSFQDTEMKAMLKRKVTHCGIVSPQDSIRGGL